jgi:hypothetical protein
LFRISRKLFIHFLEAFPPLQGFAVWIIFGFSPGGLVIDLSPGQPGSELDLLGRNQGHKELLIISQIIDISACKTITCDMLKKL